MKIIESNNEELVEGVNYFTREQETFRGKKWISYNFEIGNEFEKQKYSCISFEQMESHVRNYRFKDKKWADLRERAINEFYNK